MGEGSAAVGKVPTGFWVFAGLGLIWNAFGGYDYTMTRLRNVDYLKAAGDPQVILAWIDSFPVWAQLAWALGVWGSVAGSLLMLARSRHAVPAFQLSLAGALVSFAYQLAGHPPGVLDTPVNRVIPLVIVGVVVFFWWYCRRAVRLGQLR